MSSPQQNSIYYEGAFSRPSSHGLSSQTNSGGTRRLNPHMESTGNNNIFSLSNSKNSSEIIFAESSR